VVDSPIFLSTPLSSRFSISIRFRPPQRTSPRRFAVSAFFRHPLGSRLLLSALGDMARADVFGVLRGVWPLSYDGSPSFRHKITTTGSPSFVWLAMLSECRFFSPFPPWKVKERLLLDGLPPSPRTTLSNHVVVAPSVLYFTLFFEIYRSLFTTFPFHAESVGLGLSLWQLPYFSLLCTSGTPRSWPASHFVSGQLVLGGSTAVPAYLSGSPPQKESLPGL